MATKKETQKGRNYSSKKKETGKRKQEKKPDILTIAVVLAAAAMLVILIYNYTKDKKKKPIISTGTPTATEKLTATPVPVVTPEPDTSTPAPTKPAATTKPDAATATPTEAPIYSEADARTEISAKIELKEFSIELLDDHLFIDGTEYYSFCINDVYGKPYEPLLLVDKKKGTVYCYTDGTVSEFEKFPLDKTENINENPEKVSANWAKKQLVHCEKERLSLSKDVSEYTLRADEWTTMLQGKECYGVDVLDIVDGKEKLIGTFYIETGDGSIYSIDDETGEIIKR